jgi:hypothetical protein
MPSGDGVEGTAPGDLQSLKGTVFALIKGAESDEAHA